MIHPTAIIDPKAQLAKNVSIGPSVVIEANVSIAKGTQILANSILREGCRIGQSCVIGPYAVLGNTPMDFDFHNEESFVDIADDVVIKEFTSIHRATGEHQSTHIDRGTLIMPYVHIGHNVQVGTHCVITTSTQIAGHAQIGNYCILSSNTLVHQFCRIGDYVMGAPLSAINKDILPFSLIIDVPAKHLRLNSVGLKRRGITGERYTYIEKAMRAFRKQDLAQVKALAAESDDVKMMLDFKEQSKKGIARFTKGLTTNTPPDETA